MRVGSGRLVLWRIVPSSARQGCFLLHTTSELPPPAQPPTHPPRPHSAETLRALERHLAAFAPSYSGSGLANLLNVCAQSDALLSEDAVAAVEARALEILAQQAAAAQQRAQWGEAPLAPPQGFALGAVRRAVVPFGFAGSAGNAVLMQQVVTVDDVLV